MSSNVSRLRIAGHESDSPKKRGLWAASLVCGVFCVQGWCLAPPAFGQLAWQQQMKMQQWSRVQQMANHGAERSLAASQRASYERLGWTSQGRSSPQTVVRRTRQYSRSAVSSPAYQHSTTQIQPGDEITVLSSSTPVQIGKEKVAEVHPGVTLSVIQRQGEWIGVRAPQDGGTVAGWIHVNHVRRTGT